ncbi:PREDICTED: tripartite motif-containing protein 45-like [Acropora digitifera]|uniref:tripartite motif-containing protein 45-like n=1 Tax=Acropora digitifera TaxID=70779 RepID=UPI00077B18B9|nr:PREDICTED: tripartite motif-containing protein 45-like [Acropora digitifera]
MACSIAEKHLECAVCMEHFKEPKVLPCLHTFCKDCLKVLIKKQGSDHVITCPECRQDAKRKSIQAILQDTKAKDNAVEEGLKAVETMESRVEAKISEVSKEVDVFFNDQVKVLGYLRRDLQNELKSQGKVKLTELRRQREMLTFSLAQLRSSVEFAERALAEGDDTELLTMKHELTERLSQLNALQYQCRPCKSDYLALQVNKTIEDIGEMATILNQPVYPTKCALSMVGGEEGVMYQTLAR